MQNRNYLATSLKDAIANNDTDTVRVLIDRMFEKKVSLASFNDQGLSFLAYALQTQAYESASLLFDLQYTNPDIIFALDYAGKSLFHYAISYPEMLKKIIVVAKKTQDNEHLSWWLKPDNEGLTPLHCAAHSGVLESVTILLREIQKEEDPSSIVNHITTKTQETALHLACMVRSIDIIVHLIRAGANIYTYNYTRDYAFQKISQFEINDQINLFMQLDDKNQRIFLEAYWQMLIANPELEQIKKLYFQLANRISLFSLLKAHHEFNQAIPVRNFYITTKRPSSLINGKAVVGSTSNDPKVGEFYVVEDEETFIDDNTLESMPLYAKKVREVETDLENQMSVKDKMSSSPLVFEEIAISDENVDRLLVQDRMTLISLLQDVDFAIHDLENSPHHSYLPRAAAIIITLAVWTIFTVFAVVAGLKNALYQKEYDDGRISWDEWWNKSDAVTVPTIICGMVGGVGLTLGTGFLIRWAWKKEININPNDWKLLHDIQVDVIDKLHDIERKQNENKDSHILPTELENIRQLENVITELHRGKSISETIVDLRQLKTNLETIQNNVNLTQKPFSQFFKPKKNADIRIDMPSDEVDETSNDEKLPLLQRNSSKF